jgi:hypothetical protein
MHFRPALCAVLAAASGFPSLRAQSATLPRRFGITAGLNSATVGGGDVGDASRRTSFIVGATMVAPMSPSVVLEPQVLFTSKAECTRSCLVDQRSHSKHRVTSKRLAKA